ncbi:hypothetical protein [Arthrobacter woluwensis]|uniref:hypothetical protein n=1 Tax=Arthrobacter woluwensis TaxID=156980 RepID=UPI001AAFDF37|nr:hypothetical protein [Arthrobacter woluwensis]QTF70586.1 hypothetical protein G8758_00095 [Arthrobacter woluwensis]
MVERSTERNLYLGTRDMKPGPAADQEKTNRRQLVAKVASRTHALSETVKAVATFDAAGNMPLVLMQIGAVADDLNDAIDELMKSMGEVSHRAGLPRPLRVVLGPDAHVGGSTDKITGPQYTYEGPGFPEGIDLVDEIRKGDRPVRESGRPSPAVFRPLGEVAFPKEAIDRYVEGRIDAEELFAAGTPLAPVRVSLDESVPTPLKVARDHIDRERRAGQ